MTQTASLVSSDSGLTWTEPGAWPVAPGVVRIPLPLPMDGLRAVNVYVMETDNGLVLVDGGWAIPESREVFEASMKSAGYALSDIRRFLVTHLHRDHYTQAYVVGHEVGAPVSLGLGDKPSMDLMHDENLSGDPNLSRLEAAGALELAEGWRAMMPKGRRPSMDDYGMPDEWLDRDLTLDLGGRRVDAVATPGHTQGHYVFADAEQGLLLAGDHVLPTITPSIGFEPRWVEQPLRDFLASLAKVRALPDLRLLPAHGPVTESSHARIDELAAHHDHRLQLCVAAVAEGARTAWDVAGQIPWTRHERRRDELGPFDAVLAAFETLAHLDLLASRGELVRTEEGSERHYAVLLG
jgi:glyoxylase-like metal-dependent hydrolase (beta-lactamase superfamily II)